MEKKLENQYLDYASWKKTNSKLLDFFIEKKSKIIARFKYVIAVVDYLFEQVIYEHKTLNKDEEEMFEVGYQYIFDRFNTIEMILIHVFNNNINEMEKFAKEINLLLYIIDFEDEIDSLEGDNKKEHKAFADLEDRVMQQIEKKEHIEDGLFALVDDISLTTFERLNVEYYSITDIFYDIAIDLEIIKEDDEYYDIFEQIN